MPITLAQPLSLTRRRIVTAAVAATIGLGGASAAVAATHEHDSGSRQPAAMKVLRDYDGMCWYKGWFVDGGVPYQGLFKASC